MNMGRKNKQSNKQFLRADEGRSHIKDSYLTFIWFLFLTVQTANLREEFIHLYCNQSHSTVNAVVDLYRSSHNIQMDEVLNKKADSTISLLL